MALNLPHSQDCGLLPNRNKPRNNLLTIAFFFPPTPNPLINAFKPTHCAGWVCLSNSHHSKIRDPWNAVHGLLLFLFYFLFLPPTPNPLINALKPTFITPAYAEFHSYSSFQLPVLHSPILPSLALQVFKTRKVRERIRKGFFLAQARTRTYIAYQYKSEAQAKVLKLVQMERRIVAQIFSCEPQH